MNDIELLVPEFEYAPKNRKWYLYFALVSITLIAVALALKNYGFMAVIGVSALVILMRINRRPQLIKFIIADEGIEINNRQWRFEELENFSIHDADDKTYLTFIKKGKFQIPTRIPIKNPALIRAKLNNLLSEVEYEESLMDIITRLIGI